jgi:MoxR-like ATPase
MNRPNPLIVIAGILALSVWNPKLSAAEPLQGAAAILRQANAEPEKAPTAELSPAAKLAGEIASFPARASKLPPAEAATEWLKLFDRAAEVEPDETPRRHRGGPTKRADAGALVAALPAPEAWPELARQIEARPKLAGKKAVRELGLRLLARVLTQDRTGQLRVLAEYQATLADSTDPAAS